MRRVYLDTNILLDLVQQRKHFQEAITIMELALMGKYAIFTSTLSFANIAYIMRKCTQEQLYALLAHLAEDVQMLPLAPENVMNAISHPVRDFEDMLQYQCALAAGCDVIVTNNKRDFYGFCQLPFLTSEEFLLQIDF